MTGIEALLDILAAAGVRYIFGNPGTTELPLNDALTRDSRVRYIFGLQEVPLTAMADGYAMASGHLGVVCVHICCGLGNAMGMLYNAYREGTPLLIIAGQQDRRLRLGEPVLEGDMVSVTRPWTKWSTEVHRVGDLPTALRRAAQVALSPPTGPVFLSLPVDVQLECANGLDLSPPRGLDPRVRPPLEALQKATKILAHAQNPAILAGSRVTESGAVHELVVLAERLGAPVFAEQRTSHGRLPMPADHPLYAGALPLWAPDIRRALSDFDVILVVGMNLLRMYIHHEPARPIPDHIRLIHLDADPWELGKNIPVEIGLLGDPKAGLGELAQRVSETLPEGQAEAAAKRLRAHASRRADARETLLAEIEAQWDQEPMTALALMGALGKVLPPDGVLVEEAVTTHQNVLERLGVFRDPSGRFAHRGWALGWGLGCAIGVKLAWPDRPAVALLGDGAALYGIQGLWTAAHHHIPVCFVIANNSQYRILKVSAEVMGMPSLARGRAPGMDLVDPKVDFVGLARAFGVKAHRVSGPAELADRVRDSLQRTEPVLLDVPIES